MVLLKSLCVTSVPAAFLFSGLNRHLAEPVTPLSLPLSSFTVEAVLWFWLSAGCLLIISSVRDKGSPSPLPPTNPQHPFFWFCLRHLHKRVQRDCRGSFCVPKHPQLCLTLPRLKSVFCIFKLFSRLYMQFLEAYLGSEATNILQIYCLN